ncbi:MAG: hypothetical protein N2053_09490, partial [Chitinispirillaceae bacterium]|nr:hypothetical protein [Chitinispirillaceae bacterium]
MFQKLSTTIILLSLFSLPFADDLSYRWTTVKIGGGGFVSAIIADPKEKNLFYARTDVGGAYRWDESSKSWIPLLDWVSSEERGLLGVEAIAVDPQVKGRIYLTAGTSYWNDGKSMFLRSDDYGKTWQKIDVTSQFKVHGNGMGRANGERLAVDPNNSNIIFCGTRWNGLFKSTNRGESWTKVSSLNITTTPNENGICFVIIDKNSVKDGKSQIIYVGVSRENENLYVSKDGGETWNLIEGRPTAAGIMPQRAILSNDGNLLYVTYGNGAGPHPQQWGGVNHYYNRGAVYKYNTKSGSWTDISPVNFMAGLDSITSVHYGTYSGISIDPSNPARIVVTSVNSWRGPQYWKIDDKWKDFWGDNIFISEDSGKSWLEMFKYFWVDGGVLPEYKMMDENGIP